MIGWRARSVEKFQDGPMAEEISGGRGAGGDGQGRVQGHVCWHNQR